MSDAVRFPLVLGSVAVVSAAVLSWLHGITGPEIARREEEKRALAERIALPGAVSTQTRGACKEGRDAEGDLVGYIAEGSAYGYSSEIVVLVGVRPDMRIASIQILREKETPGLGTRIEEVPARETWLDRLSALFGGSGAAGPPPGPIRPPFQVQFDGRAREELRLSKDGGPIEAISGATISSRAVLEAVKRALARVEEALAAPRTP